MKDEDQQAEAIVGEFTDLRSRFKAFLSAVQPTEDNLFFSRLQRLHEGSLQDLAELARGGRELLERHHEYFLEGPIDRDGPFWHDLFLVISKVASAYERLVRQPIPNAAAEQLVEELVKISRYSTAHGPLDIYKRTQEALGSLLWTVEDDYLLRSARRQASALADAHVSEFLEETIAMGGDESPPSGS